jgi:hypothetical protein
MSNGMSICPKCDSQNNDSVAECRFCQYPLPVDAEAQIIRPRQETVDQTLDQIDHAESMESKHQRVLVGHLWNACDAVHTGTSHSRWSNGRDRVRFWSEFDAQDYTINGHHPRRSCDVAHHDVDHHEWVRSGDFSIAWDSVDDQTRNLQHLYRLLGTTCEEIHGQADTHPDWLRQQLDESPDLFHRGLQMFLWDLRRNGIFNRHDSKTTKDELETQSESTITTALYKLAALGIIILIVIFLVDSWNGTGNSCTGLGCDDLMIESFEDSQTNFP